MLYDNISCLEGNNKGKRMVQLREVKKPVSGLKNKKNVEREDELQRKFSQISEEEHVLKAYEANKKKVSCHYFNQCLVM